jgi:ATP-dependent Clp protease ATP-binding subunit ClpA
MDLNSLLQEFAESVTTPTIQRRQLLEYFSGKVDLAVISEHIKKVCATAAIQTNPIIYDTEKFKELVRTTKTVSEKIEQPSVELHEADGRNDPNQPDIIKTKSYRELEELMHPKYPINIYIAGETGLGKSTAVFGIAKKINRPVIRVNLSIATDIDDLIGGIRIVDGNTVFDPGPVAIAMDLGAILLLDEVDAGNPKILIDLHPVLEKKGVLAKKARKMIYPKKGFCVIATGNSKGTGDASGKYVGVNNMNHAFLERFGAALEFQPPTQDEMEQILQAALPELTFSVRKNLVVWYNQVLESYRAGGISEYIHPRKMLDIGTNCLILGARSGADTATTKAIEKGLGLKEEALIASLCALYDTMVTDYDEAQGPQQTIGEPAPVDEDGNVIPF